MWSNVLLILFLFPGEQAKSQRVINNMDFVTTKRNVHVRVSVHLFTAITSGGEANIGQPKHCKYRGFIMRSKVALMSDSLRSSYGQRAMDKLHTND